MWRLALVSVLACVALGATGCASEKSSNGSSAAVPTAPSPSPSSPALTSVAVSGPTTITVGQAAQFTATAKFSDNSTKDVTSQATWSSSALPFATVNSSGLVTAIAEGDLQVNASFQSMTGFQKFSVAKAAGFTVSGHLTDGTSGGVLPNININITDSTKASKSTTTDSRGMYSITGVAASAATLVASAVSYQTVTKNFEISGDTQVDVVLPRVTSPTPTPTPTPTPPGLPPISDQAKRYVIDYNQNAYGGGQGIARWTNFPIRVWADSGFRAQDLQDAVNIWQSATGGRVTFAIVSTANQADIVFDLSGQGVPRGNCGVEGPGQISNFVISSGFGHYLNQPQCSPNPTDGWRVGLAHGLGHILGFGGHTPSGSDLMGSPTSNWNMSPILSEVMTWLYSVPPGTRLQ